METQRLTERLKTSESDCAKLRSLARTLYAANKKLRGKVNRLTRPKLLPRLRTFLKRTFLSEGG